MSDLLVGVGCFSRAAPNGWDRISRLSCFAPVYTAETALFGQLRYVGRQRKEQAYSRLFKPREYADAVTRLRFANKDTFLVACSEVEKARIACHQARLLFEGYLAKAENLHDPENDIKC
jgi:hypothetical protein